MPSIPFFAASYRYQQVHGDLKGTPRFFTGIGWRRDGMLLDTAQMFARTIDMELWLGDGDLATFGTTFASNRVSPPTNAFVRKIVNAPDLVLRPDAMPAPFTFNVVFDTPVLYLGLQDLLWEVVIHSNSSTTRPEVTKLIIVLLKKSALTTIAIRRPIEPITKNDEKPVRSRLVT